MNIIRTIIFTMAIPGIGTTIVPYLIAKEWAYRIDIGPLKYIGLILMPAGALLYIGCAGLFVSKGKGTPAIYFSKPFKAILGEEPGLLVNAGIYRYSRNPMYLGVITVLIGESIFFGYPAILIYAIVMWIYFHLMVVFGEEPHLIKKHGETYVNYIRSTPRWFGKRRNFDFKN